MEIAAEGASVTVAVASLLGGASGSSAPGQVMVIQGVDCRGIDDSEDLDLLMHPLQFRISGVPAAGAIIGNTLLIIVVIVAFTLALKLFELLHIGSRRAGSENCSAKVKAAALLRYPSVLVPIPLMLLPGILQASFDIMFYPRGGILVSVVGWLGCFVSLAGMGVLCIFSTVPTAGPAPRNAGCVVTYLLGRERWKSHPGHALFVERYGVVFDIYRDLPWVRGRYFLLEVLPVVPMAAVTSVRSTNTDVCAAKCCVLAFIFAVWTLLLFRVRAFLAAFLLHLVVFTHAFMILGLLGHAAAFLSDDYANHWGVRWGLLLFSGSLVVAVIRALYDIITLVVDLVNACRKGTTTTTEGLLEKEVIQDWETASQVSQLHELAMTAPCLNTSGLGSGRGGVSRWHASSRLLQNSARLMQEVRDDEDSDSLQDSSSFKAPRRIRSAEHRPSLHLTPVPVKKNSLVYI